VAKRARASEQSRYSCLIIVLLILAETIGIVLVFWGLARNPQPSHADEQQRWEHDRLQWRTDKMKWEADLHRWQKERDDYAQWASTVQPFFGEPSAADHCSAWDER
jgi:hypothetical protein